MVPAKKKAINIFICFITAPTAPGEYLNNDYNNRAPHNSLGNIDIFIPLMHVIVRATVIILGIN
tara:strand:+ start:376 stop:567 length:192 start_codon:yes stop_codon:yes gene_type:complete